MVTETGARYGSLVVIQTLPSKKVGSKKVGMVECKCDCGVTTNAMKSALKSGRKTHCGCKSQENRQAANAKAAKSRQTSDAEIRRLIESRGFIWLDDSYVYSDGLSLSCHLGHKFRIELRYLTSYDTTICPDCSSTRKSAKAPIMSKPKAKPEPNPDLLSKYRLSLVGPYQNAKTPVKVVCERGHEFYIKLERLIPSRGTVSACSACKSESKDKTMALRLEKAGMTVIDPSTKTDDSLPAWRNRPSRQKMKVICEKGHVFEKDAFSLGRGHGCPICGGSFPISEEEAITRLEPLGLRLLSLSRERFKDGDRRYTVVIAECENGHVFKQKWSALMAGHHCPKCAFTTTNSFEKTISAFLKEIGVEFLFRDRLVLKGSELDFYVPSKKVAIEYCGMYWHSIQTMTERLGREKADAIRRHQKKMQECEKLGIRLITIFEGDMSMPEIVKGRLRSALNIPTEIIGARKCTVGTCSKTDAKEFLDKHHLQGSVGCTYAVKISLGERILGVLTIGPVARPNVVKSLPPGTIEIKRMAFLPGIRVTGGASKMFNMAVQIGDLRSVISFCDLRYGDGRVYKAMGFTLLSTSSPSPHHFKNLGKRGCIKISHQSLAKNRNYSSFLTVYDCGHQKWHWTRRIDNAFDNWDN